MPTTPRGIHYPDGAAQVDVAGDMQLTATTTDAAIGAEADALFTKGSVSGRGSWEKNNRTGKQTCEFVGTKTGSISNSYGSLYWGQLTWTFPRAFSSPPAVSVEAKWGSAATWATVQSVTNTAAQIRVFDCFSRSSGSIECWFTAKGQG